MGSEVDATYRRTEHHRAQVEHLEEQVAQALAQAAAWQARAEGLEGAAEYAVSYLEASLDTYRLNRRQVVPAVETEGVKRILRQHRQALSAPRPCPGRVLEVVREVLRCYGHPNCDWTGFEPLADALARLTPEERQALGEGE